jgi:DNA-binding MarR family transcriptional regulator
MSKGAKPLSEAEKELWHALKKLSEVGLAAVGSVIESATGLSGADFGILSRLEDLGGGVLPQQELQLSLGWDRSRLSHQLTRMESRGLLQRQAAARRVTVKILRNGRDVIAAARPIHAAAIREHIFPHINAKEADLIVRLVRRIEEGMRSK